LVKKSHIGRKRVKIVGEWGEGESLRGEREYKKGKQKEGITMKPGKSDSQDNIRTYYGLGVTLLVVRLYTRGERKGEKRGSRFVIKAGQPDD